MQNLLEVAHRIEFSFQARFHGAWRYGSVSLLSWQSQIVPACQVIFVLDPNKVI